MYKTILSDDGIEQLTTRQFLAKKVNAINWFFAVSNMH